ncbi:MAG TPA: CHAD domain-containing protein [Holophagaceae bacterium]
MHPAELAILLHRALEVRLARLQELLASSDWSEDMEQLHQVRVAARRLGAVLDLVDPEAYPAHKSHRRALKALVDALGLTRELDVHAERLRTQHAAARTSCHAAVVEHLQEQVDRARAKARKEMRREIERLKLPDLDRLLDVPSLPAPFQRTSLQEAAGALLAERARAALAPLADLLAQEDPPALHKGRVRLKKLRYALEALEGAFAVPPEELLGRLKALQTALGEHHDLAALEALLWEEEGRLRERDRTTLCNGLLDLLGEVAEARRATFVQAGELARGFDEEAFAAIVQPALGLPGPGDRP